MFSFVFPYYKMAHVPFGHTPHKSGVLDKATTLVSAATKIHSIYKAGAAAMPYIRAGAATLGRLAPLMMA